MKRGHLTLILCDEVAAPEPVAAKPGGVLPSKSVHYEKNRVTIHDFTTKCEPKTPRTTTPTATITVSDGHMTYSAELDRNGIAELVDNLADLLADYGKWGDR